MERISVEEEETGFESIKEIYTACLGLERPVALIPISSQSSGQNLPIFCLHQVIVVSNQTKSRPDESSRYVYGHGRIPSSLKKPCTSKTIFGDLLFEGPLYF